MYNDDMTSSEGERLRLELVGMKPILTKRLQYLKETDEKMKQFAEQIEQIEDLLVVIADDHEMVEMHGVLGIRQFLSNISDMERNHPIPREWPQRERSPNSSSERNVFETSDEGVKREAEEGWGKCTAYDNDWECSDPPEHYERRRFPYENRHAVGYDWDLERTGQQADPHVQDERGAYQIHNLGGNTTSERKIPWYDEVYKEYFSRRETVIAPPIRETRSARERYGHAKPYPTQGISSNQATTSASPAPQPPGTQKQQRQHQHHYRQSSTSCATFPSPSATPVLLKSMKQVKDEPAGFTCRSPYLKGTNTHVELVDLNDSPDHSDSPSLFSSFRNREETITERFSHNRRSRVEQEQQVSEVEVVVVDASDDEGPATTTPAIKTLPQVFEIIDLDDEGPTTATNKTLQRVVEVIDSGDDKMPTTTTLQNVIDSYDGITLTTQQDVEVIDNESPTTQPPEPVPIGNPETKQRLPVPVPIGNLEIQQRLLVPTVLQYAETESPGVTEMGGEHHLNNDPAPPPINIQQTQNVDDTSNTDIGESVGVCDIIKQEAIEYGGLALGIQMEDEFRADLETAEELISQLVTNINTMDGGQTFTNELDNREEPEGAATPGPRTDVECLVSTNGAFRVPEKPASPPPQQPPAVPEPITEIGATQAAPLDERNEPVAVPGTSKSGRRVGRPRGKAKPPTSSEGLSADQPANQGHAMRLRNRDSSGKTAPPPPKRRYQPKETTTQYESEDEETKGKREEESRKFFQHPRAENGLPIITRHNIQVNPYLCMIKLEPDLVGIKVEDESA